MTRRPKQVHPDQDPGTRFVYALKEILDAYVSGGEANSNRDAAIRLGVSAGQLKRYRAAEGEGPNASTIASMAARLQPTPRGQPVTTERAVRNVIRFLQRYPGLGADRSGLAIATLSELLNQHDLARVIELFQRWDRMGVTDRMLAVSAQITDALEKVTGRT